MTGISQLAAQSKKPVGLESGRALREFSDIESERFMVVGQSYEQLFLDASEQIIDLIRDAHVNNDAYTVASFDKKTGMEKVKWSDINLEDDQFIIQIKPIGSLPQTPSAKLSSVNEMMLNGMFTKEEAHQLLDFPDLEQANRMKIGFIEVVDKIIEKILEDGDYTSPEVYMNLEFGIARMQQAYSLAILDDVPHQKMELMRRWMSQANMLLEQRNAPAPGQAAGAPGPGMPMPGMPMPPIPNQAALAAPPVPGPPAPPAAPGAGAQIPPELLAQLA